jgi:hypothetical protein
MSDQSNVEKGFRTAWPFVLPNVAETVQFQMRALLQEQAELLDEAQKIMGPATDIVVDGFAGLADFDRYRQT